jgi:predicted DNA-binding transcriptional regulator AlpA
MSNTAAPEKQPRRRLLTRRSPEGFEHIADLVKRLGISASTLYSWQADKSTGFPAPVQLGKRFVIYNTELVNSWLAERTKPVPAAVTA